MPTSDGRMAMKPTASLARSLQTGMDCGDRWVCGQLEGVRPRAPTRYDNGGGDDTIAIAAMTM
ncbi:MAG: hypothetical protein ACFB4J_13645 [Elainellaceae cyanobacterium]